MAAFDELYAALGDAVADIRERHEEAWFGRVVTERGEAYQRPEPSVEPEPTGLNGEVLGPEVEPVQTHGDAGLLGHGWVVDGECSREWPQATEALTYNPEQEPERTQDMGRGR